MLYYLVYQAISAPFVFYHPQVHRDVLVQDSWLGHIDAKDWGVWADGLLLLIFGGIPWQVLILSNYCITLTVHRNVVATDLSLFQEIW